MKIETKFSMGDEVWFMYENKVVSSKVTSITAKLYFDSMYDMRIRVNYNFDLIYTKVIKVDGSYLNAPGAEIHIEMRESEIFKTKQELLKSL